MESETIPAIPHRRCKCCPCYLMQHEHEVCDACLAAKRECKADYAATLRAVYDRVFDSALAGLCTNVKYLSPVDMIRDAHEIALESVRTHATRMKALDDVIAELEGETR